MKFIYHFRTRDNVLHSGIIRAADKESAFTELRAKGIRPSRIDDAPGFFNKLFGKGKRWIAIVLLAATIVALVTALSMKTDSDRVDVENGEYSQRHQIYGDPATIDEMMANGFSNVFSNDAERFLSAYAMPGASISQTVRLGSPNELSSCLTNKIVFLADDAREVRELKAIVNGIKEELREYLSDGVGTCATFVRRLEERQEEERLIYRRVRNELDENSDPALWEDRNRSLRDMGIRTIPRQRKRTDAL